MKKITVELWFEDDFVPSDYFEEPIVGKRFYNKCMDCPLYSWNDDYGNGECHFCGEWEEKDGKSICPIKKYFTEEAKQ